MSRCFPYPPPGYTLSRASEDALIESIKLQKIRKRDKELRKERRKEEKERRKEKNEKRKEKKERANHKYKYDISEGLTGKNIGANSDRLEKSGLTEEHEQPVCLRVPSSSADSTENSTKRKRDVSPFDGRCGHGNIIRIRMNSKKQDSFDSSIHERPCSTSGRTVISAQIKDDIDRKNKPEAILDCIQETNKFGQGFIGRADKELIPLISEKKDAGASGGTETLSVLNEVRTSIQKRELKYKKLIQNWLPLQLEHTCLGTDDLDWLFHGKNQGVQDEKRRDSGSDSLTCSSSSTLRQPRAHYLPEVDVHALPFTVPFA